MVKAATSAQVIFEQARIVGEMIARVEQFLNGVITREALRGWARSASPDGKALRFLNPHAALLYGCLCGLDDRMEQTQEYIVRRIDLAAHLHKLRSGQLVGPREPQPPIIALVKLSAEEIAQRTGAAVTRFFWEGLGWYESVYFSSAGAGTSFIAMSAMREGQGQRAARKEPSSLIYGWERPAEALHRAWQLAVLFDALCIDSTDATNLWAQPAVAWDLMRQDDNGNKFLVGSFTGYAKARARIEQLDALQHKQLYWLEQRDLADAAT